jgi:ABC-type phosphate transport system ATPase subunit
MALIGHPMGKVHFSAHRSIAMNDCNCGNRVAGEVSIAGRTFTSSVDVVEVAAKSWHGVSGSSNRSQVNLDNVAYACESTGYRNEGRVGERVEQALRRCIFGTKLKTGSQKRRL